MIDNLEIINTLYQLQKRKLKNAIMFAKFYKSNFPILWDKQIKNCKRIGMDMNICAKEAFNFYFQNLETLNDIAILIEKEAESIGQRIISKYALCFDSKKIYVYIYIDLNSGAGWATYLNTKEYAILIGLKTLFTLEMSSPEIIKKILSHEFGHLIHWMYRKNLEEIILYEQMTEYDSVYTIYSEGFAQDIACDFLGDECWFQPKEWIDWCNRNFEILAAGYLERLLKGISVEDFFNSLKTYRGKSQTGYYLGLKFIRYLRSFYPIESIAKLSMKKIYEYLLKFLQVS